MTSLIKVAIVAAFIYWATKAELDNDDFGDQG